MIIILFSYIKVHISMTATEVITVVSKKMKQQ